MTQTLCDFDNDAMTCPRCGYKAGGRQWCRLCIGPACLAGTALHKLLGFAIRTEEGCTPCADKAAEMDRRGCDWCEQNLDVIVGWLRENHARMRAELELKGEKLPWLLRRDFSVKAAKVLVKLAIWQAIRKAREDRDNHST